MIQITNIINHLFSVADSDGDSLYFHIFKPNFMYVLNLKGFLDMSDFFFISTVFFFRCFDLNFLNFPASKIKTNTGRNKKPLKTRCKIKSSEIVRKSLLDLMNTSLYWRISKLYH